MFQIFSNLKNAYITHKRYASLVFLCNQFFKDYIMLKDKRPVSVRRLIFSFQDRVTQITSIK